MTENTSSQAESVPQPKVLSREVSTDIEENILDNYENPTYHFRLYMMSPGAVARQEYGNQANAERVVIAESGVTPIAIEDVSITTTGSISKDAGTGVATNIQFTLMEPFGVTLLDQIQRAAYFLGIDNFQKFPWYLELTFKGRRHPEIDDSEYNVRLSDGDAPLKNLAWVWPIQLTNMAMNVTTGGTVYAMQAVPYAEHAYTNESSDLEEAVTIEADTVGEFFTELQRQLNKRESDKTETSKYSHIDQYQFFLDDLIYNAEITELTAEEKANRAASYEVVGGKMTFTFQAGTSIDKIVRNILSLTDYFQKEVLSTSDPDNPGESTGGEETIYQKLWRVVADTEVGPYDNTRNDYSRTYKYLIIPWTATTVQTPANITSGQTDQQRVNAHRKKGLIKKVYNYIYTGLNDQVFDFELNFNFNWYIALPIQGGLTTVASKKEPKGAMTTEQKEKWEKWANKIDNASEFLANPPGFAPLSQLEDWLNGNINSLTTALEPATNAVNAATASVNDVIGTANASAQSALDTVQSGMPVVPDPIAGVVQNPATPFISGASSTLNNLTDLTKIPRISTPSANVGLPNKAQQNIRALDTQLDAPEVIEAANQKIKASIIEAQSGKESSDGQDFAARPGQTLLSAMFEQAESPVSRDLINIDLNIKGDPYWLEPAPIRLGNPPSSHFRRLMANRGVNPDSTGGNTNQNSNFQDLENVSSANTAEGEVLMVFRSFTPQEFDPETGLTPAGKKSANVLNGIYGVRMVHHEFSGGEFKQRLQGIRDINTNLRNVDLYAELRDTPESTAAESTNPITDILTSDVAQGAASILDATITLTNVTQQRIDTVANLINPNNTFSSGVSTSTTSSTIGPVISTAIGAAAIGAGAIGTGGPRIQPINPSNIGTSPQPSTAGTDGRTSGRGGPRRRYGTRYDGRFSRYYGSDYYYTQRR
jgi:hypothetical protein